MISALFRRIGWIIRRALGLRPRSAPEELWRLRYLRRAKPAVPGAVVWAGAPLYYAHGPAVHDQLNEIIVRGVYDFVSDSPSPRILDCGAHVGVGILRWRQLFPNADITAFEADPSIASRLQRNLAARGDTQTKVIAAAAWVADGTVKFCPTGTDNGHISEIAKDSVPARNLVSYCAEPVDLLKLDIEGAEERVLLHLHETGALPAIRRLVCEWHEWTAQAPSLHAILARLVSAGFVYRLAGAGCLGNDPSPAFPNLGWPGNHIMLYAWQPSASRHP